MSKFQFDKYDTYADEFDPMQSDRQSRRKRKQKVRHEPKKAEQAIIEELADDVSAVEFANYETTYNPSIYEAEWLLSSLRTFYDQTLITDVLAQVKGGKEASVYKCAAHPSTGVDYLAAKVYRPRQFRSLSNDAAYREGRLMLNADGKEITDKDKRTIRAVEKKSSYGSLVAHTSWIMHEVTTIKKLYDLGAPVPKIYGNGENGILMSFYGDAYETAHTLVELKLHPDEVQPLFDSVMETVELMLRQDIIHGDLSAYNILYWEGAITLIDFPQVINPHQNSNAYELLLRDITRVCEYFARYGVQADPQHIHDRLWGRYIAPKPHERAADLSRYEYQAEED